MSEHKCKLEAGVDETLERLKKLGLGTKAQASTDPGALLDRALAEAAMWRAKVAEIGAYAETLAGMVEVASLGLDRIAAMNVAPREGRAREVAMETLTRMAELTGGGK